MDKYTVYCLLIALGCLGLSSLVWVFGWRSGTLYLHGTPVRRKEEPLQFWITMALFGGIPAGFGLVLLIVVLIHM